MKKIILLWFMFLCCLQFNNAQPGNLDSSFGKNGIVTADLGVPYNYPGFAKKVLLQPDGAIYLIIQTFNRTIITKRHPDGSTDTTYGKKGFTIAEMIITNDAALQPDGKIVLVGTLVEDFAVIRYNASGALDSTFSNDGKQTTDFVYVVSNTDEAHGVAIQSDGKIVVVGETAIYNYSFTIYQVAIARYNADGSLDKSFSEDGIELDKTFITIGPAHAVTIQEDQKILIATAANNASDDSKPSIVRYKTDGSLDSTFGSNGLQPTNSIGEAKSIAIQPDGKVVAIGSNFNLARFNTDGSLDNSFSGDGMQTTDFDGQNGSSSSLAIQTNGKIVVAGYIGVDPDFNFALARYNPAGSLDNSFSGDGKQTTDFEGKNDVANSLVLQSDGKIVAAGSAFVLYNTNGSLDNTFNKYGKLPTNVHSGYTVFERALFQKDGKIVVVGRTWNGSDFNSHLVRYNTNGSSDTTFEADEIPIKFTGHVGNDGKRVVVTDGTTIARYNADGSPDHSFSEDGKQQNDFRINSIAIQNDGKIVVVGSVSSLDSNYNDSNYINSNFTIARYNIDGNLDNSFSDDGKLTTYFYDNTDGSEEHVDSHAYAVAIKNEGEIVVVGQHSRWDHNYPNMGVFAYYSINGRLDSISKFIIPSNSYINGYISSITIGNNAKIVITCHYDYYPYSQEQGVVLIGTDFYKELDVPYGNYSVAIQNHGKIILGGSILARYDADGSTDSTFGNNGKQTPAVNINSIAISDNKLYTTGSVNP